MTTSIGPYTRLKRVEAGLSQKQVADALGLSKSAICRRESGDSGWRWVEIEKLTFLLGITLAAFVAGFKNQGE